MREKGALELGHAARQSCVGRSLTLPVGKLVRTTNTSISLAMMPSQLVLTTSRSKCRLEDEPSTTKRWILQQAAQCLL